MTSRNRETLKNYFREGQLPTEDHFADLIDSMLNMSDEGFRKSVEHGEEISAPIGYDALISFFRDQDPQSPLWSMGFTSGSNQLVFRNGPMVREASSGQENQEAPLLCLDAHQGLGILNAEPKAELDVAGTLRCHGRQGSKPLPPGAAIAADGAWHDITGDLHGCQAFEVVAGTGHRGTGRYGLLHAIALNTYNPTLGILDFLNRKRGIRCTHAYYSRRCDRLQLRWSGTSGRDATYRLQIRTGCDFGEGSTLRVQLTQLWSDPHMEGDPQ